MRSAKLRMGSVAAKGGRSRTHSQDISPNEIRRELERVLSSSMFSIADRMTRFLRFVVEETLEGRGDNLNELLLGMAVYNRDQEFDPRVDSIVRVDAGRLRAKLREFYASEGAESSIGIDIPKGSYRAVFKRMQGKDSVNLQELRAKGPMATKTLAVLPFADLSPQTGHRFLGDGIVEELVHALSLVREIRVASLTSVLAVKGDRTDVKELGRQLGVDSLIEGSVRQVKQRMRIMVRLTDTATGFHTWSEVYALTSRDVFATQEKVSKSIAEALSAQIGTEATVANSKKRPAR